MSLQPTHVPHPDLLAVDDTVEGGESGVWFFCPCDASFTVLDELVRHGQSCPVLIDIEDELELLHAQPVGSRTSLPGWVSTDRQLLDVCLAMLDQQRRPQWVAALLEEGARALAAGVTVAELRSREAAEQVAVWESHGWCAA